MTKRVAALLAVLFLASTAVAAWNAPFTYKYEMGVCPGSAAGTQCIAAQTCTAGTCNGTAPTGTTEGMLLGGVAAFRLVTCAAVGQTLSGAGTLQAYLYNSAEGVWIRNSKLDVSVTATTRCQAFPGWNTDVRFDRVRFVASGVTVSGGAGLDVLLDGQGVSPSR